MSIGVPAGILTSRTAWDGPEASGTDGDDWTGFAAADAVVLSCAKTAEANKIKAKKTKALFFTVNAPSMSRTGAIAVPQKNKGAAPESGSAFLQLGQA